MGYGSSNYLYLLSKYLLKRGTEVLFDSSRIKVQTLPSSGFNFKPYIRNTTCLVGPHSSRVLEMWPAKSQFQHDVYLQPHDNISRLMSREFPLKFVKHTPHTSMILSVHKHKII